MDRKLDIIQDCDSKYSSLYCLNYYLFQFLILYLLFDLRMTTECLLIYLNYFLMKVYFLQLMLLINLFLFIYRKLAHYITSNLDLLEVKKILLLIMIVVGSVEDDIIFLDSYYTFLEIHLYNLNYYYLFLNLSYLVGSYQSFDFNFKKYFLNLCLLELMYLKLNCRNFSFFIQIVLRLIKHKYFNLWNFLIIFFKNPL